MNVGLIVYSYTGNTLSVAEKIRAALQQKGHTVTLERITAADPNPNNRAPVTLTNTPDPKPYDQLILAAPVNGFSLAMVMQAYLNSRPQLTGKPVSLFVTHAFPKAWLGGNQTIRQFKSSVEANGATVLQTGVINWMNRKREAEITDLAEQFSSL
jgi:flavodoxin